MEWIRFDNEDSSNADDQGGSHPHGAGIDNHKIHYCYYQGKQFEMLDALYSLKKPYTKVHLTIQDIN